MATLDPPATPEALAAENRRLRVRLENAHHAREIQEAITDQQRAIQRRLNDDLARALAEIERKNRELEELNRSLERRVEERTAELRRVLDDLREARSLENVVLENSTSGICLVRGTTAAWANSRFCELFSVGPRELVDLKLEALFADPTEHARRADAVAATLARGASYEIETRFRASDGRVFLGCLVGRALEPGRLSAGTVWTIDDVTERRAEEERQRSLELRMLQAQKLESLGVMAGGIAHDFNNLLTAILGNAELAEHALPPGSPVDANLAEILRTSRRAADLCRQMLAYAGRASFAVEPLDLSALVRDMSEMLAVSVSKRASVRLVLADRPVPVLADPSQVRQIVMNLLINASDALADEPGTITLATGTTWCSQVRLDAALLGAGRTEGEYAWLEVADTGCGIEAATLARVFDPFFTTKAAGRGLGLAAVSGIVRGHQGAIEVDSAPGRGTRFRVLLPAGRVPVPAPADAPPRGARRGSGLALLVDDEEGIRRLGEAMLTRAGFDVACAADGIEALEVLAARGGEVRAVVLDLSMPRMAGPETLREIRRLYPDLPVLVTSGYGERSIVAQCADSRPTALLQKPYHWRDLVDGLLGILGE